MNYEFPLIRNMDDVLPHIKDRSEFIVAERDDHTVINYVVQMEDTFPAVDVAGGSAKMRAQRALTAAVRRECRGLIFDRNGELISRPYHKFFNQGEREETHPNRIDLSQPHHVMHKMDGSMIRSVWIGSDLRLGTKMGITEVAMAAEEFMASAPHLGVRELCEHMRAQNITPIFEWCSPENRIVVDYSEPDLVLTALRDNTTGVYAPYDVMVATARNHGVNAVGVVGAEELATVADAEGIEGYVIRFADGHMVKLKCAWYTRLHGVIDIVRNPRRVVQLLLNNQLDDVKPMMQPADLDRVVKYEHDVMSAITEYARRVHDITDNARANSRDRKEFAQMHALKQPPLMRSLMFSLYGEVTMSRAQQLVMQRVLDNTNRDVNFASVQEEIMPGVCLWK